MKIDKVRLVALLVSRGLDDRAVWVERQLPDRIDVVRNGALLEMLKVSPADFDDLVMQ